ncbi:unnamed protein product [Symbiodinium microadriaticum]|nr:unnamed protein product [Symbiodinium microadriaticum]
MDMLRGLLVLMAVASSEIAFPIEDDSSIMMLQVRAKRVDNQTNQSYHPDSQTNQSYHPEKMEKHYHHHSHHHHGSGLHYPTKPCLPPICKHQDTKGRCESAGCDWHDFASSFSYDGTCSGYAYHFDDPDATSHSCYSFFDKYKCLATNGCRWETNSWSSNGICDGESRLYCGGQWSADPCDVFSCASQLGLALVEQRPKEAEVLFRRAHKGYLKALGLESTATATAALNLAESRKRLGRPDEAPTVSTQNLLQVPDGDVKVMVRGCRGCYLAGAAGCKVHEAEVNFRFVYEREPRPSLHGKAPFCHNAAPATLSALHEAGRHQEARELFELATDGLERTLGADHPNYKAARASQNYEDLKRSAGAAASFRRDPQRMADLLIKTGLIDLGTRKKIGTTREVCKMFYALMGAHKLESDVFSVLRLWEWFIALSNEDLGSTDKYKGLEETARDYVAACPRYLGRTPSYIESGEMDPDQCDKDVPGPYLRVRFEESDDGIYRWRQNIAEEKRPEISDAWKPLPCDYLSGTFCSPSMKIPGPAADRVRPLPNKLCAWLRGRSVPKLVSIKHSIEQTPPYDFLREEEQEETDEKGSVVMVTYLYVWYKTLQGEVYYRRLTKGGGLGEEYDGGKEVHPQLLRVQEDLGVGSRGRLGVSSQGCHLAVGEPEPIESYPRPAEGSQGGQRLEFTTLEDGAAEFYQQK